jgi:hypothetical protein
MKIRFPYLDVEYKSQAKVGTHVIATNQAANAGAIALNCKLELIRRCSDPECFDLNKPQFFSITMDHHTAVINLHWVSQMENGQDRFHSRELKSYLLREADGLRSIQRAVKNILDYGLIERLPEVCKALDVYREIVLKENADEARKRNGTQAHTAPQPESPQSPADQAQEESQDDIEVEDIALASVEENEGDEPQKEAAPPQPAQRRSGRKPTPTQRPVQKSTSPPVRQSKRKGVTKKAPAKAQTKSLAKTMHTKQVTRAMEAVAG